MQLVLSIGDKVLDRMAIKPDLIGDTDYIAAMQRLLLVKNGLALLAHLQEPTFYFEAPSSMDKK